MAISRVFFSPFFLRFVLFEKSWSEQLGIHGVMIFPPHYLIIVYFPDSVKTHTSHTPCNIIIHTVVAWIAVGATLLQRRSSFSLIVVVRFVLDLVL